MKKWYRSRTIWVAIIQAIIGILVIFETQYPSTGAIVILKSILDIITRFITELPIEK